MHFFVRTCIHELNRQFAEEKVSIFGPAVPFGEKDNETGVTVTGAFDLICRATGALMFVVASTPNPAGLPDR